MRTKFTQKAVANMTLAQGYSALELHLGCSGTRGVARNAIGAIGPLALCVPAAGLARHVAADMAGVQIFHDYERVDDGPT